MNKNKIILLVVAIVIILAGMFFFISNRNKKMNNLPENQGAEQDNLSLDQQLQKEAQDNGPDNPEQAKTIIDALNDASQKEEQPVE